MRTLDLIMKEFGSDKSTHHSYTEIYEKQFFPLKEQELNIFELGLGTNNTDVPSNMGEHGKPGASLRGWKEYFPNSNIYGADIDKRILFEEERIKTYYVDQGNYNDIINLWNHDDLKNIEFDIMIDDGIHQPDPTFLFLKNSIHKLKSGGFYFIEDINVALIDYYKQFIYSINKNNNLDFDILDLSNDKNLFLSKTDNVLAIITKKFE